MPVALPLKISLPEKETTVNLKSASFIVIMPLHKGLTRIHSQIKPMLLFPKSFTLMFQTNVKLVKELFASYKVDMFPHASLQSFL